MRILVAGILFFALDSLSGASPAHPAPEIRVSKIVSPAAPNSLGASFTTAPNGELWLSWVEPSAMASHAAKPAAAPAEHHHGETPDSGQNTLRFAIFDASTHQWSSARTIVTGHGVPTSNADFPLLAIDGHGHVFALWQDGHGSAFLSESPDRGVTWSAPAAWTKESEVVEKFSLCRLADGRILAAWLDGRGRQPNDGSTQKLHARIVGANTPDVLVDPAVCDCCQTALTAFPDGTALVAYRGRTKEEVRDIRTARFRGQTWDQPRGLNDDDWRINACPINGPRLASDGGRIAVAWFTAANSEPSVFASYSPDAGARFIIPLRLDRGKPMGNVDTLILHDGALLATWLEIDGSFWLRRVSPEFAAGEPVALNASFGARVKGFPRLALVRDYTGGEGTAEFVTAFTLDGPGGGVRTALVTVPEGRLLEAERSCDCAPTSEQLQGFSIRGTITSAAAGRLTAKHFEVPGVFAAGTREFKVAPGEAAHLQSGREFLGRIERRAGVWWLFDIRLVSIAK